jgi:NADPH:quinone reductase-like Zn-dependent oxidoreductase
VQLAKAFGNTVTGTARTADKLDRAADLGLDHGVLAPDPFDAAALGQAVLDAGGTADVVVELVGGGYLDVDLAVTALQGRIVVVGTLAGGNVEIPLFTLMRKRLALHGTVLRARTIEQKAAATAAFAADVLPLLHDGKLQPVVDRVLPLDAAADAYELMASNTTFGKVILSIV